MTSPLQTWEEKSRRELAAALEEVRGALEACCTDEPASVDISPSTGPIAFASENTDASRVVLPEAFVPDSAPADELAPEDERSALSRLVSAFSLSPFERSLLLLCAGIELCPDFHALCATFHADERKNFATLTLAMAAFAEPDWSTLTPSSTLRRWRLIDLGTGERLTVSPLRIDERILHYLCGVSHLDERLQGLIEPCGPPVELPESQHAAVRRIAETWSSTPGPGSWPVIQLGGNDPAGQRAVAATACAALGIQLRTIRAADLPSEAALRDGFARLWEREAMLADCALLIEDEDRPAGEASRSLLPFMESTQALLFATSTDILRSRRRRMVRVEVDRPSIREQKAIWTATLGPSGAQLNGQLELIANQFDLSLISIAAAGDEALEQWQHRPEQDLGQVLWEACRRQARPKLDDLAHRIPSAATWEDLVLPLGHIQVLRSIAAHVRGRGRVYDDWGFADRSARGLGISALFSGASGTGKTMAAEVLANELKLDLYRIDLSAMVSKYIGETEKNLRRVFDAAEEGGAILLFDEADALFGKRSEVKDSHDRYANIEVSYLLQRVEAYRGLAILTSNLKNALDAAFMRRLRFIVHFPFPDTAQRVEIWRRIFPTSTPTEGLNLEKLAGLNLSGGNIRNLALNAAFFAADAGEAVQMKHLAAAAQGEYAKLEKPLSESDLGGWV
jgi:hypothetical protein